jgi:acyl carrier protein
LTQSNISNWDSINHLNLIIEFETTFDINIDPEEIIIMNDFNSIYSILKQKIKT